MPYPLCKGDGKEVKVNVPDMVFGDMVVLVTGDVVPVDFSRLSPTMQCERDGLTREPDDVAMNSK